jgi:hypothetical protein
MRVSSIFLGLAAIALVPSAALAKETDAAPAKAENKAGDYIPFANHGGVWDWHADGTSAVYFQDRHKVWYRAELIGTATDLPWVQFIGLDTRPSGRLDKWSAIYVRGHRFAFSSFEKVDGPLPWKKPKDKAKPKS